MLSGPSWIFSIFLSHLYVSSRISIFPAVVESKELIHVGGLHEHQWNEAHNEQDETENVELQVPINVGIVPPAAKVYHCTNNSNRHQDDEAWWNQELCHRSLLILLVKIAELSLELLIVFVPVDEVGINEVHRAGWDHDAEETVQPNRSWALNHCFWFGWAFLYFRKISISSCHTFHLR